MSPEPFKTSTSTRHGGGSGAPAAGLRRSGLAPARLQPSGKVICDIDVSWEAQIVARHEDGAEAAGAVVGHERPDAAGEHDGMAADAAVAGRDDRLVPLAPGGD